LKKDFILLIFLLDKDPFHNSIMMTVFGVLTAHSCLGGKVL